MNFNFLKFAIFIKALIIIYTTVKYTLHNLSMKNWNSHTSYVYLRVLEWCMSYFTGDSYHSGIPSPELDRKESSQPTMRQ